MEKKNYAEVNKHHEKYQPEEHLIVSYLNRAMLTHYPAFVRAGVVFRVQSKENQFAKFDCQLIWINAERGVTILATGELEFGADQMRFDDDTRNWEYEFPKWAWGCLSLLMRKKYGENFQFFLKVSPSYSSAFVVDTRNDFVGTTRDAEEEMERDSTNDQFDTNKWRYAFNWDTVDKHKFTCKDNKIVDRGNICLMEWDRWKDIIVFFSSKFFPEELKKEIRKQTDVIKEQLRQLEIKQEKRT